MQRPHEDYQKTHRSPRVLIVANKLEEYQGEYDEYDIEAATRHMASELGCYCMQMCSDSPNNVHVLVPGKYQSTIGQMLQKVFDQAAANQQPYDVIIVDSEKCADEIRRIAATMNPKPGILVFTGRDMGLAASLRNAGTPAFHSLDILPDKNHRCVYDEQVKAALGEEGIKRLEVAPDQKNSYDQWSDDTKRASEVVPAGVARTVTSFAVRR